MEYIRPSWDEWALGIAEAVSRRGDCTRRRVGAVLLDTQHRLVSAGYNGTRPGGPSCLAGDCPRGRHYRCTCANADPHCRCANPWPCDEAVDPGSSYDTGPGACHSTHAEINAVMDVDDRTRLNGATLYVTSAPCDGCIKIINNTTRITAIVWKDGVRKF